MVFRLKKRPKPLFGVGQNVHIVPLPGRHYRYAHYFQIHKRHWSADSQEWLYDGQHALCVVEVVDGRVTARFRFTHPGSDIPEGRLNKIGGDTWNARTR